MLWLNWGFSYLKSNNLPPKSCPGRFGSGRDTTPGFYPSGSCTASQPASSWAPPGLEKLLPRWTGKKQLQKSTRGLCLPSCAELWRRMRTDKRPSREVRWDSSSANCSLDESDLARPFCAWVTVRAASSSTPAKKAASRSATDRGRVNPRVFTGKWATCCRSQLIWERAKAHRIRPAGEVTAGPREGDSAFTLSFFFLGSSAADLTRDLDFQP